MNQERLTLLENYMKLGISPLLISNISASLFHHAVVLKANIPNSELNGHYENMDFCPPMWYRELVEKSKTSYGILVIENINEIPLQEQSKFIEILKYKKISTFDLPKNCLILVTCSDSYTNQINEEVYSLVAQI